MVANVEKDQINAESDLPAPLEPPLNAEVFFDYAE
jgi:hypothetical protein